MLTEICQYLRNWFVVKIHIDTFKIENGVLTFSDGEALPLFDGQYYRVVNSTFNDGVYKAGQDVLVDETFSGAVFAMAVPPLLIQLDEEITKWVSDNQAALNTPYASESFGGYSYSLRNGNGNTGDSSAPTWQSQFASRLAPWRKI